MQNLLHKRCLDLARLGMGRVNPNPLVGSLLTNDEKIIGEGFHKKYGQAHAEVNCLNSVPVSKTQLIPHGNLYVSLEPCCIVGNTGACTDLILKNKIKKVNIGAIDSTSGVNGQGVNILKNSDIDVKIASSNLAEWMIRFRTTFVTKKRPHIILKYAVTKDNFIGKKDKAVWLTSPISKRLVHKWRSEVSAIMVGTNTALIDNPQLNNRLYYGPSPLRIVLDRTHKIPDHFHLKDDQHPTWIVCEKAKDDSHFHQTKFINLDFDNHLLPNLMTTLYDAKINSLLVEGGATLLQHFIDQNLWDEAYIFHTNKMLGDGVKAPELGGTVVEEFDVGGDMVIWKRRGIEYPISNKE